MKKTRICIFTMLMIIMLSITVFADGKRSSSNLFLFSDSANTTENVNGDVYAFAQDIKINSLVGGDVISCGQDITIKSDEILGNIRGAGQSLDVDVKNTKNITLAGQDISIGENTNCNAAYIASQSVDFKGNTNDLYVSAQDVVIDGKVKGNLEVNGENILITENANILGNIKIKSPNEAIVKGDMASKNINYENTASEANFKQEHKSNVLSEVMSIVTAMIVALLLFVIFKNYFYSVEKSLDLCLWKYMLVGFGILILVPVLIVFLCITVIGIPIGLVILFLYILSIYLCPMVTGITLGQRFLANKNIYLQVICGVLVIKILLLIPFIDAIAWVVCIMFTLGSICMKIVNYIYSKSNKI